MINLKEAGIDFLVPTVRNLEAYGTDDPELPSTVYKGFQLAVIDSGTILEKEHLLQLEKVLGKKVSGSTWEKISFPAQVAKLSIVMFIPEKEYFYIVPIDSPSIRFV